MTPLYLALMGLDPTSGKAELRQTNAGVDFLGGVHSAGDLTTGTTGSPANDRISEPAVRNWVLSLASSIVHLLQKPAASIVASYPAAQVEEEEESAAGEEEEETTPPPLATPSSTEPPANASTANGISLTTDTEDWAAHEALHHYPEAHRPRHKHRPSAGGLQPLPADAPRRRSLRSDAGNADGAPTVTVPVLQSSVDDSAVPYTYAQQANIGPDPATLAAFLHYNYPSFSMMHVPAKDYTGSSHVHGADDAALQHQRTPLKVQCIVRCRIPTEDNRGTFYLHYYINNKDGEHHMAIVYGDDLKSATLEADRKGETDFDRIARGAAVGPARQITDATGKPPLLGNTTTPANDSTPRPPPLVRIHSACFTGETVGSARCDCAEQLQEAMRQIQEEGRGVVVYLRQEGRGIGLADKMRAYNLQDLGHDTVNANLALHLPADARTYEIACLMLQDLGIDEVRLLTNNPTKIQGLTDGGMKIVETRSMIPMKWQALMEGAANGHDHDHGRENHHSKSGAIQGKRVPSPPEGSSLSGSGSGPLPVIKELDGYLLTKIERMGHRLDVPAAVLTAAAKKNNINATEALAD